MASDRFVTPAEFDAAYERVVASSPWIQELRRQGRSHMTTFAALSKDLQAEALGKMKMREVTAGGVSFGFVTTEVVDAK